jgi:hypothetical protein
VAAFIRVRAALYRAGGKRVKGTGPGFLGMNVRKQGGKLLVVPSAMNVNSRRDKILLDAMGEMA